MELFRSILQIAFPLLIALYALINIWQLKDLKWDIELERTIIQLIQSLFNTSTIIFLYCS